MPNTASIIGIDMGGTSIKAGLLRNGALGKLLSLPVDRGDSVVVCLHKLKVLINTLRCADTQGIGIGVPSVVDTTKGIVYDVQNIPSWKEMPLQHILEQETQLPVSINNDANCFTLGEWHFGKGRGYNNMVGLTLGTGMGAGLILNDQLYTGTNCGAGELGMLSYKSGCLENYTSGQFFAQQHRLRGEDVFEQAKVGEEKAIGLFEEFGKHLAQAICATVYAYDPELIVLGGSVSLGYPYFQKSMLDELHKFPFQQSMRKLQILQSEKADIAVLGAAALVSNLK